MIAELELSLTGVTLSLTPEFDMPSFESVVDKASAKEVHWRRWRSRLEMGIGVAVVRGRTAARRRRRSEDGSCIFVGLILNEGGKRTGGSGWGSWWNEENVGKTVLLEEHNM